jgi:hypothetical protein
VGGVEDRAREIQQAALVDPVEYGLVEPAPDASPRPDQEPSMRGGLRYAETRWQGSPGTPADQDVDDRCEQRLIRRVLRPAALRPHPRWRNQRLRDLPQPVRNNPTPRTSTHVQLNETLPHRTRSFRPADGSPARERVASPLALSGCFRARRGNLAVLGSAVRHRVHRRVYQGTWAPGPRVPRRA